MNYNLNYYHWYNCFSLFFTNVYNTLSLELITVLIHFYSFMFNDIEVLINLAEAICKKKKIRNSRFFFKTLCHPYSRPTSLQLRITTT